MLVAYVFCLILSGALLALSLATDFLDADTGGLDVDLDVDADTGGLAEATRILSLRGALYFLFGFGLVGTALSLLLPDLSVATIAGSASFAGLASGFLATSLFGYLKRSESGEVADQSVFVGLPGRIIVPISPQGVGQVRVERHLGTVDLIAVPFPGAEGDPTTWLQVVVVEMDNGRAQVVPAHEGLLPEAT